MSDYRQMVIDAARKYNVPVELALALVQQESKFKTTARSHKDAYGLMQLMEGTARELGVDRNDPAQNIDGGVRYLAQQLKRFGSTPLALAAYNAGPGRVVQYRGIPPWNETQNYVRTIMKNSGLLGQADPAAPAARVPAAPASGPGYVIPETVRGGLLDYQPASDVDALARELLPLTYEQGY